MAQKNCSACDDLRKDAPNFTANALGTTEITSLKNNTGLNPKNSNDDCKDLNNMADCLIGNMTSEVDSYDNCHWHEFAKEYINNAWQMFKGIIAAICGLWTKVKKHDCEIDYLMNGASFSIGEATTDGSYVVAGKGVSFLERSSSGTSSDIRLLYIAGGLARLLGSLRFHEKNWNDPSSCYNYDTQGIDPRQSTARLGNGVWKTTGAIRSELIFEIRIKREQYPVIRALYSGFGQEASGGAFHTAIEVVTAGEYAPGQHGPCNAETGAPVIEGDDRGHLVPDGWVYVQMRATWIGEIIPPGDVEIANVTPRGFLGIRIRQDEIPC